MPKCPKCGKKFSSLQALNDHFRSIHPNEKFVPPKQASSARTLIVIIVIVIIVMGSIVGLLIYFQLNTKSNINSIDEQYIGQTIPTALYQNLSGVSESTLNAVGVGQGVTKPSAVTGSALANNGKPEVLYIGAEYCPYCATERWAMIIALSKFGTFSNISLMLSSASDAYANTATFSFLNSSYTSPYISFVSVESEDRNRNPLQTITSDEQSLLNQYDPSTSSCLGGGCIPFLDFGNSTGNWYTIVGAQNIPSVLRVGNTANGAPYNWTQIGSQVNNPNSIIAQSVDGAANTLITAICNITGGNPSSVCTQSYANISLAALFEPSGSQTTPIISVVRPMKVIEPVL